MAFTLKNEQFFPKIIYNILLFRDGYEPKKYIRYFILGIIDESESNYENYFIVLTFTAKCYEM